MPSPFDSDLAAAEAALAEVLGTSVGIRRAGSGTSTATAEVAVTDYEVDDEDTGPPQTIQSRDFLIAAADYKIDGSQVEPRAGDRLIETINGSQCEFEAVPIGKRPAAEWANVARTRWLIHTQQVKQCPVS